MKIRSFNGDDDDVDDYIRPIMEIINQTTRTLNTRVSGKNGVTRRFPRTTGAVVRRLLRLLQRQPHLLAACETRTHSRSQRNSLPQLRLHDLGHDVRLGSTVHGDILHS